MLESSQKSIEIEVENELQPYFIDMIYAVFHNGEFQTSKTATDLLSVLRLSDQVGPPFVYQLIANLC